jgi:hypothetical protein
MKYVSENKATRKSLELWSGTTKRHTSSYFFLNQGNEMQKTRVGLVQSLLYQILRSAPELMPSDLGNRWEHETWDISQLVSAFERIASQTELDVKYCLDVV